MRGNIMLSVEELKAQRGEVLKAWPTGQRVDLEEALAYVKSLPEKVRVVAALKRALESGETLTSGRAGVATVEGQIEVLKCLKESGLMDVLPITTDSFTRNGLFDRCERGIRESEQKHVSVLNGFPVVNHGVEGGRRIVEEVMAPIVLRILGLDVRLAWEIGLASGFTSGAGNDITHFGTYSKNETYEQVFHNYQYIERLFGYYQENGVPIYRECHGLNMRAVVIPPSLYNAVQVIMVLTMAAQGVKHIGPCSPIQGNLIQDMAAVNVLLRVARRYLEKFRYKDVTFYKVLNAWGGTYPVDEAQVYMLLAFSAAVANFTGAQMIYCKSTDEALRVPKKENNAAGARAMKLTLKLFQGVRWPITEELREEEQQIELETKLIIDKVLEFGNGDPAIGFAKALERGVVDIPFSPNTNVRDKVIPLRDSTRAVRYYDTGNLPFTKEIKKFHRDRLDHRFAQAMGKNEYDLLVEDVMGGLSLDSLQVLVN